MNAAEQAMLAIRLAAAFTQAGVTVERAVTDGGNVVRWEPVPMTALLGAIMERKWRVTDEQPMGNETRGNGPARVLRLERVK